VGRVEQDKKPDVQAATIDVTFCHCTRATLESRAPVSAHRGGSTIAPPDAGQRLENDQ
jgi:hypothetical protein